MHTNYDRKYRTWLLYEAGITHRLYIMSVRGYTTDTYVHLARIVMLHDAPIVRRARLLRPCCKAAKSEERAAGVAALQS